MFNGKYYDEMVCVCKYQGLIKDAFARFKFSNKPSYYRFFSKILSEELKLIADYKAIDMIVSVPLHNKRQSERGYNQSELISKEVGKLLGITYSGNILFKTRDTVRQSLLNKNNRSLSVENLYHVKNSIRIQGKTILLVDDIFTTGSTLEACSRVLKESGATKIIAAAVASGRKY